MKYTSPFRRTTEDHDGTGNSCLSRLEHDLDPLDDTLTDFWNTFVYLASGRSPDEPEFRPPGPVLFYLGRHLAELTLKSWAPPGTHGHQLDKLLAKVPEDHALCDPSNSYLREFIADLADCDPVGDQGRYGTRSDGTPSLSGVCCMDTSSFIDLVQQLVRLGANDSQAAPTGS